MAEEQSFDDLARSLGVEVPDISAGVVENTGTTFYEHKNGSHKVILLDYKEKWFKKDGDKSTETKPNEAGAKPSGHYRWFIIADPEGTTINQDFTPKEGVEYGRLVWNQYVTLEGDKQFANKNLFQNFFIDGVPQASVVIGDRDFKINLKALAFYYGAPATMNLTDEYKGKKAKRPFVDSVELDSHSLTKEILQKRKMVADKLSAILAELKAKEEKERKDKQKESQSGASNAAPPMEDSTEGDDILSNYN